MSLRITSTRGPAAQNPPVVAGQRAPARNTRRLLAIVDHAVQPYCLGDMLIYQTGSMVAAREAGVEKIDFCLLSDPDFPPRDPIMARLVSRDNHYQHLMSALPIVQLNPQLGAVHVFDSRSAFHRFLSQNEDHYRLWPSREDLDPGRYLFYDVFKAVHRFFQSNGDIPAPRPSSALRTWAHDFFRRHASPRVPVTVNLRNNPEFHTHRNSNLPAWKAFFDHCNGRYPVVFIVTCAASEVDDGMRACPNVVFAKDHHTGIVQDLALIGEAAFHLGAPSGPAAMPIFGTKPYYIFNCDMLPHLAAYEGSLVQTDEGDLAYSFARSYQRFGVELETAAEISRQFEQIWSSQDWPRTHGAETSAGEARA